jgi:bacterial/archaeal transporter family-2 protein
LYLKWVRSIRGLLAKASWYNYLGGILIVFIVYLVAASIAKVGAANATTAILVGQIVTAMLLDHLGILGLEQIPWEWNQGVGIVFLAIGAHLMLK